MFELTSPPDEKINPTAGVRPDHISRHFGSLPSGGMCPCGGKLHYSAWETIYEFRERCSCQACGRTEFATKLKEPI